MFKVISRVKIGIFKFFKSIGKAIVRLCGFLKSIYYMHYIASAIALGFVAVAVFVFPNGIVRIWESLKDLFWSVVFYGVKIFEIKYEVVPTVNKYSSIPWTPIWGLPATWDEFQALWSTYWRIWVSGENFMAYMAALGEGMRLFSQILLCAVFPIVFLLYILFQRYFKNVNNDYDKDSKALTFAKWLAMRTYKPLFTWVSRFFQFLRSHDKYVKIWLFIWAYCFNVITIAIEFFAFYFYFVVSFDFFNIYRQIYKLFCDLSVPIAFIPTWVWIIIGYLTLCHVRKKIGYSILRHHEARNCGFINELPIVVMICGTMGKKKTTMMTDMILLQEKMFREKALSLMIECDLKFPNFPWIKLEKYIQHCMERHTMYSLATIRKMIRHHKGLFNISIKHPRNDMHIKRHLRKKFGYVYENFIFEYDYEKYGTIYDDKLKAVDIWSVIESYAQLYFIYVIKSTLIVSNYSVRTDSIVEDLGNLPMRDDDFYTRNSKFIDKLSRYANIIDFNAMRLGKLYGDPNDLKKDSFEFGAVGITEGGKERKNNLQLQELKKKDETANQKNDGFNDWLKVIRHSGTIMYVPFCKVFMDEQRPESWGADGRDLCEIVHIKDGGEVKLAMPFFALTELFYSFFYDKFVNFYLKYRFVRGDNTLPMYIFKRVIAKLQHYYKGVYNTFGYAKMSVQVESGTQDGILSDKAYFLDNKRIYADRFSTDCFSEFFTTKSLRSSVGLDDLEEYKTSKASFEELEKQNSYFVADLINKRERDK